jgi:hypothetical protein
MSTKKKITSVIQQIIPAQNWCALYKKGDDTIIVPLVCWALTQELKSDAITATTIIGLVADGGDVVPAASVNGFSHYDVTIDEIEGDFSEMAN